LKELEVEMDAMKFEETGTITQTSFDIRVKANVTE
jgi:hypothetical protein